MRGRAVPAALAARMAARPDTKWARSTTALALVAWSLLAHPAHADDASEYTGTCDASAVVILDGDRFVVASDEDNILRVYRFGARAPIAKLDLNPFLGSVAGAEDSEADLEAAAPLGDSVLWIGSHGRSRKGRLRAQRAVLFATRRSHDGLETTGVVHRTMLSELSRFAESESPDLAAAIRLDLPKARHLAPKKEGLNIEGLVAGPGGTRLWIGLRNPTTDSKAVIIEATNPLEVTAGDAELRFSAIHLLDLAGDGIRAMDLDVKRSRYLVVSGPRGNDGPISLWSWGGVGATPTKLTTFTDLRVEAIAVSPAGGWALVVSDDGSQLVDGVECKKLSDPGRKRFHARKIAL